MTQDLPEATALASVVQLIGRARGAKDRAELKYILVNETYKLIPYRLAALWLDGENIAAMSGVVSADANAPFVLWLKQLMLSQKVLINKGDIYPLNIADLSSDDREQVRHWLSEYSLLIPLPSLPRGFSGGFLLLTRDKQWSIAELTLLKEWTDCWPFFYAIKDQRVDWGWIAHHFSKKMPVQFSSKGSNESVGVIKRYHFWLLLSFALLFLPVNLTVLAPAELVPFKPSVIRAPLDGIIDSVSVKPNQTVSKNDALFKFDRISINNRLQVAQRELDTVKAEYRQKAQLALMDLDSKANLVLLQSKINEKTTEIAFLLQLNKRSTVLSPQNGIVLFDDPTEWIGRPVVTGERVMIIANETATEIEGWLSPADAIELADDARVRLYLNADPLKSLSGSLRYISHEATARPDGRYAYRIRAKLLDNTQKTRIGLRGTIRLEGERVSLAYWIFRRPFATARAWLGI